MSKKERTWRSGVTTQWPLDNGLESGKITANSFLSMMSYSSNSQYGHFLSVIVVSSHVIPLNPECGK
ncbi:hypothetical protein D9M71_770010 [compost metagenome]